MGLLTFFANYAKWTRSFGAVHNLRRHSSLLIRIIWWLILVSMFAAFIVHTVFILKNYLEFGSTATRKYVSLPSIPFPGVTMCSTNAFKNNQINSNTKLSGLMNAYNFVLSERKKILKSIRENNTYVSSSSQEKPSNETMLFRSKRQGCSTRPFPNQYNWNLTYSETYCNGNTNINFYCENGTIALVLTGRTKLAYELQLHHRTIIDAAFHYCLRQYTCGGQNVCTTFPDTMSILHYVNSCLTSQGLIDELGYPPNASIGNPVNNMAMQLGSICTNYTNRFHTYAFFRKPTDVFTGTYWYSAIMDAQYKDLNVTIENCDRSGTYFISTRINSTCPKTYDDIAAEIVEPMTTYECGKKCALYTCPYTNVSMLECGNSDYYDLMCSFFSVCNETSTTQLLTSTPFESSSSEIETTLGIFTTTQLSTSSTNRAETTSLISSSSTSSLKTGSSSTESFSTPKIATSVKTSSISSTESFSTSKKVITSTPFESSTTKTETTSEILSSTEGFSTSEIPIRIETSTVLTTVKTSPIPSSLTSSLMTEIFSTPEMSTNAESSTVLTSVETEFSTTEIPTSAEVSSISSSLTTERSSTPEILTSDESSTVLTSTELSSTPEIPTNAESSSIPIISTSFLTTESFSTPKILTIAESSSIPNSPTSSFIIKLSSTERFSTQPVKLTDSSSTIQSLTSKNSPTDVFITSHSTTVPTSTISTSTSKPESQSIINIPTSTKIESTAGIITSQSVAQTMQRIPPSTSQHSTQISTSHVSTLTQVSSSVKSTQRSTAFHQTTVKSSPAQTWSIVKSTQLSTSQSPTIKSSPAQTSTSHVSIPNQTSSNVISTQTSTSHVSTPEKTHKSSPAQTSFIFQSSTQPSTVQSTQTSTSRVSTPAQTSSISQSPTTVKSIQPSTSQSSTQPSTVQSTQQSTSRVSTPAKTSPKISDSITTSAQKQTISTGFSSSTTPFDSIISKMTDREVANLWGLSEHQSQPSLIAHVRQALIEISASLSPEERQMLFYSLPELVSSCKMENTPCDMDNDFVQTFDVDYGYCYTYNPKMPIGSHNTTRTGRKHGLRIVLFTDPITYMNTTELTGFKVTIHSQNYSPFPNTEGYFVEVGQRVDFVLSESRYTRLDKPYGNCDTLNTLKERGQPFFFNGSYSIEGCLRSCFQQKLVDACGCADPRLPYMGPDKFCTHENLTNHKCNQNYITQYGDYPFVNCTCHHPCSETNFYAKLGHKKWPSGNFFSEQYCPAAELADKECGEYYVENSAEIHIYYNRFSYLLLEQIPNSRVIDLISGIGNSSYTWIGCTLFTLAEILLLAIQVMLWSFCCRFELPEVPSCRRRNDSTDEEKKESPELSNPNGLDRVYPLPNVLNEDASKLTCDEFPAQNESEYTHIKYDKSDFKLMYNRLVPLEFGNNMPPAPSGCSASPTPPFLDI